MGLRKEDVYINLQGKSKEELTELWWLLKNNNQKTCSNSLESFIRCHYKCNINIGLEFYDHEWVGTDNDDNKQEVTIEQLKEILKPTDLSLTEQLEKAKAEVKRLQKAIEEENKPKVGDLCKFWDNGHGKNFVISVLCNYDLVLGFYFDYYRGYHNAEKITDQDLINKLIDTP